jgi:hypothetical protein
MKAVLIIIENDADHAAAMELVAQWMASDDPGDQPRLAAQARLIEHYERRRWPRRPISLARARRRYAAADLPDDTLVTVKAARMDSRHAALDKLLKK